jgi:adenosylcobinamide kinase/adenosylcobinamide-phosphate guanylyltransferase
MGRLYYITGGAGSGKSEYAEQLAERLHAELGGPLYYVATMNPAPRDSDAAARIAKHQKRRAGRGYTTLECSTDIAQLRALLTNGSNQPDIAAGALHMSETPAPVLISQAEDSSHASGASADASRAVVLLEDLTNLYANEVYGTLGHPHEIVAPLLELRQQAGAVIIVANELYSDGIDYGLETDRFLRDLAGIAAALSNAADQVTEVVYGIQIQLKA